MRPFTDEYEKLLNQLGSPDVDERRRALARVDALGASRAVPLLLKALKDPDDECRLIAASLLGSKQDARIVRQVQDLIDNEPNCGNRLWMRVVIVGCGFVDMIPDLADDIGCVDEAMGGRKNWAEATALAQCLAGVSETGEPAICEMTRHANSVVRWIAVMALSQNLSRDSMNAICARETDEDPQVRETALDVREGFVRDLYVPLERRAG